MNKLRLHLASGSPRRREILDALGLPYSWSATDIDETPLAGETAERMVLRLAAAKARAATGQPSTVILAADTAVVLDSQMLGKPASVDEAMDMLARLSGRTHLVFTGVAALAPAVEQTAMSRSEVRFREISVDEAAVYCRSGEYRGKAGGYGIQGLAGVFVESISGSYSGVVGLPVFETAKLLRAAGIDVLRLTTLAGHAP
ncbi:MAG: Maf family nucleotide pyrophosphatase [Woeseiaceae bacterium]|nr:Maf family nucleotide pyrophosphatase [Woeseiaceae bacterium]